MNEFEFARAVLGQFKTKGDEIIPRLCPVCHGGEHGDKDTFALNWRTHVYKCLRGSCDAHGHFSQLCKQFCIEADRDVEYAAPAVRRSYKRPETKLESPTDQVSRYLSLRGLTAETVQAFGVASSGGNILFPFYRTMEDFENLAPAFVKFRKPEKIPKGGRKMWREKDTEPILFGMHLCTPNRPRLYLFEGEFDCMCGRQATGLNCVSVPSGCEDFLWLETCAEWLTMFDEIAVFADNDAAGRKMLYELGKKLDCKVFRPEFALYGNFKDANEILVRMGEVSVRTIMEAMQPMPVQGLLNLGDVENVDMSSLPRVMTGIPSLDRMTGGMLYGDLSVWTGKRGEGKSTLLSQLLLEAVEAGCNVCAYSGEIPANRLKYIVNLQAAGGEFTQSRTDEKTGRTVSYVSGAYLDKIQQWYNGHFWVYDNHIVQTDETESILKLFELAYRRYDCRIFLVDNLMTVNSTAKERDALQMQADFAVKLRKLADKLGVHIHLVAHPRKTDGTIKDSDSVSGLAAVTNIACNVFSVHRCGEQERAEFSCDSVISCLKNRMYGEQGDIRLRYNSVSRRFTEAGQDEVLFSWVNQPIFETERSAPPF